MCMRHVHDVSMFNLSMLGTHTQLGKPCRPPFSTFPHSASPTSMYTLPPPSSPAPHHLSPQELRNAFKGADTDGDGVVDRAQVTVVVLYVFVSAPH